MDSNASDSADAWSCSSDFLPPSACCFRSHLRGLSAELHPGGKDWRAFGVPGGLPLIVRFSYLI